MHDCAHIAKCDVSRPTRHPLGDASGNNVRLCDQVTQESSGRSGMSLTPSRPRHIIAGIPGYLGVSTRLRLPLQVADLGVHLSR